MVHKIFQLIMITLFLVVVAGCSSQTIVKYQCADGSFVNSVDLCVSKTYPETVCPELNCADCPVKTETKTVLEKVYVCSDFTQVKSLEDCKTQEQREIESSKYPLVTTINGVRTANSIGSSSLEVLKPNEHYLVVDFSLYNKEIEEGYEFNPNNVLVEDSQGYSYSYSWDSPSLSKYWGGMTGVTIEHNKKKSGELAFVVPKSEKEFTLVVRGFLGVKSKKSFSLG